MKKNDASFAVGAFLAQKDLQHSNPWTTLLIVFVMSLTFLNMVLVGGILVGLAEGMVNSFKQYYSSDLFITSTIDNPSIKQTGNIVSVAESIPGFQSVSQRVTYPTKIEYDYRTKIEITDTVESSQAILTGIDPVAEDNVSQLSKKIIEGEYLDVTDVNSVLLGANLLEKYSNRMSNSSEQLLKTVQVGSMIKIIVGNVEKEVIVKGIFKTNNNNIDVRVFMLDSSVRTIIGKKDLNVNEIAIKLKEDSDLELARSYLKNNISNTDEIIIQTAEESVPGTTADITKTFRLLGNLVGAIALIVGAITIFIVIFVNAITKRKYIGILKGIGISSKAIEISYVLQSLFYAVSGIFFASLFLMGFLKPFLEIHPLVLPIAESKLATTPNELFIRAIILIITSLISGFVPARLVTKQNTLDSILGR